MVLVKQFSRFGFGATTQNLSQLANGTAIGVRMWCVWAANIDLSFQHVEPKPDLNIQVGTLQRLQQHPGLGLRQTLL